MQDFNKNTTLISLILNLKQNRSEFSDKLLENIHNLGHIYFGFL